MKALFRLALPTSAIFLGLMLMGLVDMLFVGKLGPAALGGLGLGNSIFSWVMTIGIGMTFGLDFPSARAIGAGDRPRAFRVFIQGLYLSVGLAIPATLVIGGVALILPRFGLNAEVVPFASAYLLMTAVSYLPIFFFNSAKSYLQAQSIAVPTFVVLVLANGLNLFLDAALIEGRFGFPNLGFNGLAISTVIGRFFMAGLLVGYVFWREIRAKVVFAVRGALRFYPTILREVLVLGTPASAQMLLEVGVFSLSTALAAKFAATELAAHQIVLQTASILFMVPLGIGSAASSLVGQAVGAENPGLACRTGNSALVLGFGFALISSTLLIVFAEPVLGIYTRDGAVIESAKKILFIAALFQISDGAQAISTGALRGLGNTLTAAVTNGVGHWLIGLPLGLYFGFYRGMGITGIWIGLAAGLTSVAGTLVFSWMKAMRGSSVARAPVEA
jgi:MATE family multidrug resistance protein